MANDTAEPEAGFYPLGDESKYKEADRQLNHLMKAIADCNKTIEHTQRVLEQSRDVLNKTNDLLAKVGRI